MHQTFILRADEEHFEQKGKNNMKTLIIGTGVIGTIYGCTLSESGVDITHLVRKGRKQEYLKGIDLDVYDTRGGIILKRSYKNIIQN